MVVQSIEELRKRVQECWRLTRDRKGFKMRGPGGRWERVSRDLEVGPLSSMRRRGPRGVEGKGLRGAAQGKGATVP